MINKIKKLTTVFLKDYYQKLNIINKKNNKINHKSTFAWLLLIFMVALIYLSFKIINYLGKAGQPILFLKIYLPIIAIIMLFQLIILTCNLFYYSKDLTYILPLPVKTTEILISKLNTIITILYFMEGLLLVVPLFMYGILIEKTINYFITMVITLITFPILFTAIISIIMLFIMKLSKYIKNKDIFQLIVTCLLTILLSYTITTSLQDNVLKDLEQNIEINLQENTENNIEKKPIITEEKLDKINKNFVIINPTIKMMTANNFIEIILNLIKIILINLIAIIIFLFIGNKLYLKTVLLNIQNINKNKKINKKLNYKKENKIISYIKIDIKKIIKNPIFFIQNILQYIFIGIIVGVLIKLLLPIFIEQIKTDNMLEQIGIEAFKLQATLIVIGIIQIIFTFSKLSITAISREGENAIFMKYIPISLYTQFKIKTLPQKIINTIIILIVLTVIYLQIAEISFLYYIIAFITAMIINLINSELMVLLDLKKPNLNWTNEASLAKDSGNKLYQYVLTIITLLILSYFSRILDGVNFVPSIIIINIILILFYLGLNIFINKKINKIFNKIY